MRKARDWRRFLFTIFIATTVLLPPAQASAQAVPLLRVIVTTDGEIDDRDSMIRFLMYSNEWDVEALIHSSSRFHWLGHDWSGLEWLQAQISMYERVYPNLRKHAEGFPTPDELRKKVYVGNIDNVGEMERATPGADRIVEVLLDDKPGPVYLQAWGGTNTIARALKTIQEEHPGEIDKVNRKAIVYIILDQDATFRRYIEPKLAEAPGAGKLAAVLGSRVRRPAPRPNLIERFSGPGSKATSLWIGARWSGLTKRRAARFCRRAIRRHSCIRSRLVCAVWKVRLTADGEGASSRRSPAERTRWTVCERRRRSV